MIRIYRIRYYTDINTVVYAVYIASISISYIYIEYGTIPYQIPQYTQYTSLDWDVTECPEAGGKRHQCMYMPP